MTAALDNSQRERFWSAVRFAQVRSAKRERARRSKYLPSGLFAEPAWDILLELYSFELVGHRASEAELIERVDVPTSVGLRWAKMLEVENLLLRSVDPVDPAVVQVRLTARGQEAMDAYFSDQD